MTPRATRSLVTVKKSLIHGRGLFAAADIKKGTLIGVFEGRRTNRDGAYVLWVEEDGGETYGIQGQNDMRFVNHDCNSNAHFEGEEFYAVKHIAAGEEITHDYGEEWD